MPRKPKKARTKPGGHKRTRGRPIRPQSLRTLWSRMGSDPTLPKKPQDEDTL